MVGGLPGTGKSTLARSLAEEHGFHLIRSDLVRKELAQLALRTAATSPMEPGSIAPPGMIGLMPSV